MKEHRQLAAIMFTDIVGYSAMMSKDEKLAMGVLGKNREIHKAAIERFSGQYIKEIGDGTLSIFQTSSDAVNCALAIQKMCCNETDFSIRIGIHIGEIIIVENDVFGDGVNIASRIEAAGESGGIYISGRVYEDIKNKTEIHVEFVGEKKLKNITDPVKIYSVISDDQETAISKIVLDRKRKKRRKKIVWIIGMFLLGVAINFLVIFLIDKYNTGRQEEIGKLEKSIAVLPLKNWSQDEEYAYLGDAIADEIIMQLTNIREIRVLSLTSTLRYKDNPKPMSQIGEELGVNYIIEGGIQRHNDDLSIRVQFLRAKNEDHLWAEEYKGEWKDIYNFQNEIAKKIASQLETVLSPEELNKIQKEPTQNFEAYRLYLKGNNLRQTKEPDILEALNYYKQAIEIDSTFALAWSGLAESYCMLMWYAPPSMDVYPNAEQAALKALELDDKLPEAYASLGLVKLMNWEWKAAESNFIKAIDLNPNHSDFHVYYGLILTYTDRLEEAIEEIEKGCLLNPLSIGAFNNLGMVYITNRNYEKVIKVTEEAMNVFPVKEFHTYLGQAYLYEGMFEKALDFFLVRDDRIWTGITYAEMGELDEAYEILQEIQLMEKTRYVSPFLKSLLLFSLGQMDKGFKCLERAYDEHDLELTEIKTYPLLDPIISDSRYKEILKKIGFK